MKNINITLPDDLHHQLKLLSVLKGTTLKALITTTLSETLSETQEQQPHIKTHTAGRQQPARQHPHHPLDKKKTP
ncbi:hypothetical protein D6783_01675 [Candidatus Woesearchaeota archaeon]|nr:MAG: hypothetical protein D6783_01675 [Candidatus Woesearchaeota archaeon]